MSMLLASLFTTTMTVVNLPSVTPELPRYALNQTGWRPEVHASLQKMLKDHDTNRTKIKPVAVFDWDNTVVKNDIGDATFYYMLKHDEILQPPNKNWRAINSSLSDAALTALDTACGKLAKADKPLPTSSAKGQACADALLSIYEDEKTPSGDPAWIAGSTTLFWKAPYAFVAQVQQGHTPKDMRRIAKAAIDEAIAAPIGSTQHIGSRDVVAWLRIYEPMRDLIKTLDNSGFDVWVVSASAQPLVEVGASYVGIPQNHVVGVRANINKIGKLSARIEVCGQMPVNSVMTFDEGKRCWINKEIFKIPEKDQAKRASDLAKRPVFVAGDADTDIAMLKDATEHALVIHRHKTQISCNALADKTGKWLLQPMFIEPKATASKPFACSTAVDVLGNRILDENGAIFTDQMDRDLTFAVEKKP